MPSTMQRKSTSSTTKVSAKLYYQEERIAHWDQVAKEADHRLGISGYYHRRLAQIYQFLTAPKQHILEIGCGQGNLLASLDPLVGIGIDFSNEAIRKAKIRHPDLDFQVMDVHNLEQLDIDQPFDIIILSDVVNDLWDVQQTFTQLARFTHPRTRIIINTYSRLWEFPLTIAEKLRLAKPTLLQNWLTVEDINNLLALSGFEIVRSWPEILWPISTPFVSLLLNKGLVKFWPFKFLSLTNFILARPQPSQSHENNRASVSVVIAARNEAGNIADIFSRVPQMGHKTELVFIEGHSTDNTYEVIESEIAKNPQWSCQLYQQTGKGKGDAIRLGFKKAKGDILMILDADLTVPPEDLPRFIDALVSGKGDFINGVRLVYPMEDEAMRFFNFLGNKFFSLAFSWLLGQSIKDTLCGTKVLWKRDYNIIAANRAYFGDFDPFGDFDLLFGASKLGLKIIDLPIRYRERVYGETNISRWKHGWLLLKMVIKAARLIKFV